MVRNGKQTCFEKFFIGFELFLTVDKQAVTKPHNNRQYRILANMQQYSLALEPETFLQIGIVYIQIHIPKMLDCYHVLVAFFRI